MSPEAKITYVTLLADPSIHPKYEAALKEVNGELGKHHSMFIDGRRVVASDGEFDVRSPLDTKILLGYFQKGTSQHARKAIESGKDAFEEWSRKPWTERVQIIRKAARLMETDRYKLAALITLEVGKNRYEAVAEVSEAIDFLDYYADLLEKNDGYVKPMHSGAPGETSKSVLRPYGVWAVISPFNFPLALATGMVASALITGNTVVFHPTSAAPLSGLKLYETLINAGVPPGALSFITGPGEEFGNEVTRSLDVAGIAFTGSRDVGMKLYRDFVNKQPYPKPFIAEMGSKNPALITSNADLEKAAEGVVRSAFGYGGQKCSATSRVYVERGVKNDFLKILKEKVDNLRVGDPRDKETFVGPVINEKAVKKFQRSLELAKKDGGKIIAGGMPEDKKLSKGYYVKPTVVTGLPSNDRLMKDELFLPFVVVDEVKNIDEALQKANDTDFGLTAGIFSNSQNEIDSFFKNIDFGVTYANRRGGATTGAWPGSQPFGGWKGSGATGKGVGGPYYLLEFMHEQAQTIVRDA